MNTKALNPRNARDPSGDSGPFYVIAQGAPQHYVDGYGLCNAGAIITLAPGVDPGRWMLEVAQDDAEKAMASDSDAQRLAALAAAKIKTGGNADDRKRKQAVDKDAKARLEAAEKAKAQAEADGIAKVAAAEAATKEEAGKAAAEKARADAAEAELEAARQQLAAVQSQLEAANAGKSSK